MALFKRSKKSSIVQPRKPFAFSTGLGQSQKMVVYPVSITIAFEGKRQREMFKEILELATERISQKPPGLYGEHFEAIYDLLEKLKVELP